MHDETTIRISEETHALLLATWKQFEVEQRRSISLDQFLELAALQALRTFRRTTARS